MHSLGQNTNDHNEHEIGAGTKLPGWRKSFSGAKHFLGYSKNFSVLSMFTIIKSMHWNEQYKTVDIHD